MCPMIGLKSAVIVVGGCKYSLEDVTASEEAGSWYDGGVASGSVVKRTPAVTVNDHTVSPRN